MNKTQLESKLRNDYLSIIATELSNKEYEVLRVSANELAIPCLDDEQNEKWIVVKVSTPRGTRNGEGGYIPYDGYAVAEDYRLDSEAKAEAKAKKEKKTE